MPRPLSRFPLREHGTVIPRTVGIRPFFLCVCTAALLVAAVPPSRAGTIVRFDTEYGLFDVELFDSDVPTTVNNFLSYVTSGAYNNTLVHRSLQSPPSGIAVIQGGGFDPTFSQIPTAAPIPLEYQIPNTRGTIAVARQFAPNTGTNQWFINTIDNSAALAPGGFSADGYAVFGEVLGSGMDVVDAINAVPTYDDIPSNNLFLLDDVPLHDFNEGVDDPVDHTVLVNSVTVVPEPPASMAALAAVGMLLFARFRRARGAAIE